MHGILHNACHVLHQPHALLLDEKVHKPVTIVARQSQIRTDPDVALSVLYDGVHHVTSKPVACSETTCAGQRLPHGHIDHTEQQKADKKYSYIHFQSFLSAKIKKKSTKMAICRKNADECREFELHSIKKYVTLQSKT